MGPDLDNLFVKLGYVLLYIAAGLTLWSMYVYLRVAWPDLSRGMNVNPSDRGPDQGP